MNVCSPIVLRYWYSGVDAKDFLNRTLANVNQSFIISVTVFSRALSNLFSAQSAKNKNKIRSNSIKVTIIDWIEWFDHRLGAQQLRNYFSTLRLFCSPWRPGRHSRHSTRTYRQHNQLWSIPNSSSRISSMYYAYNDRIFDAEIMWWKIANISDHSTQQSYVCFIYQLLQS